MSAATVSLTDVAAFCDTFGVVLRVIAAYPDGQWEPEACQSPAQAEAWQTYIAAGAGRWQPAGEQRVGNVAKTDNDKRSAK